MSATRHHLPHRQPQAGFTLLEMVVTLAIVGILTAIALPAYRNYVTKSHVKGAAADLVALALVMESQHQLTLTYPTNATLPSTTDTHFTAFGPAESANFSYSAAIPTTNPNGYLLTATGKSTGAVPGCTLTLDNSNTRSFTQGGGASACGGLSSW